MGTGRGGRFSGTPGASQPYAETYRVVKEEFTKDRKTPDIYDPKTGYFKNPSAKNLKDAISGNYIYQNGKVKANGKMAYVMDEKGNIIFSIRNNPNNPFSRAPHPTLIEGKDPKVKCAGMIEFRGGKIYGIDNKSGHYRPNIKSLKKVEEALNKLYKKNPQLFSKDSKWRKQ